MNRSDVALTGRVIVVTGAAGGIGASTARALADLGGSLVLLDSSNASLRSVAAELGDRVLLARCVDVRSSSDLSGVADALRGIGMGVDALINNAAVYAQGPLLDLPEGDFEWCVDVNLHGLVRCCRAFVPLMAGRAGAHVVNVLSEFAWLPFPNKASYCVSKCAAAMASACLRTELGAKGVRVSDFVPPAVDTGLVRNARGADAAALARETEVVRAHGKPADAVGRAIARLIRRPRDANYFGLMPRLAVLAARLAPSFARRAAARAAAKMGLS